MNKKELVEALAVQNDTTKKSMGEMVDAVLETVTAALEAGEDVEFYGFGKFKIGTKKAYTARNPKTGEPVAVPEKTTVTFKASKRLKDIVNG